MAILPVNNMNQMPNFFADGVRARQAGQLDREYQSQQSDKTALRGFGAGILAGDPAAFGQAAAIDPRAAQQYQDADDGQLRRLKGFVTYVDQAREQAQKTGDMRAVNAALQQGAPFVSQILGKPGPTEWSPEMEPGWEALKAKIAMADGGGAQGRVQSTYVDDQGQRVAIMADGTQKVLGGNDAGMSQQTISIPGPDGRPRQYTFDKRSGNYVPAGEGGGQQPAATPQATQQLPQGGAQAVVDQVAASANQMIAAGVPDAQVEAWAQQQLQGGAQGSMAPGAPMPQRTPQSGGAFVGRSPEEQAALTTGAQEQVKARTQMQYLPQELSMRGNAAVDQAVRIDSGKAQVERSAAAPAAIATMQTSLASIDALLESPGLGGIVGIGSMNPLNRIPGTEARGLIARADQVAGQSFLAAFNQLKGGGAITEREGQAATAAMARLDRSQNEDDYKQSLRDLKAAITPALERQRASLSSAQQTVGGGGQNQPAQGVQRARNPQTGQVLVLMNGQWVPE